MPVVGLYVAPVIGRGMSITKLPSIEPDLGVAAMMGHATAAMVGTITEPRLPELEDFNTEDPGRRSGRSGTRRSCEPCPRRTSARWRWRRPPAPSKNGVDTRRFPISITVGEGATVIIDYSPEAFMTAEDVHEYWGSAASSPP